MENYSNEWLGSPERKHASAYRPNSIDIHDPNRSFGGSPTSFGGSPRHGVAEAFPPSEEQQKTMENILKEEIPSHLPRHGAPLSALEQIGTELMGIGMMSAIDTSSQLFRVIIQTNTHGELWPASKFVARLNRMRDMRSFALTQREVGKTLRMAFDDVVNQRWGLDAKLVRTSRDNSELFFITKPVEARRLLRIKDMQNPKIQKQKESRQLVQKRDTNPSDREIDMSFAADRVGKEVGKMEHIANVLLMMISAEKRERHGLLNNVQHMGQMLDANRFGVEKVSEKMESLHITQAEDRRMYQEQVDALTGEHEVALKQKHMMAGVRHLRMTFQLRQRRIMTRAWLHFREFVDEIIRNQAVGKAMCQNIIGKRLLIGKRRVEISFFRWRKMVQHEIRKEHLVYVQSAVRQYWVQCLVLVARSALKRHLSLHFRVWMTIASMQGRAYNLPRRTWAILHVAASLKRRTILSYAFTYWWQRARLIVNCANRVYHLLGKTYRGRLDIGFSKLRLNSLNGAFGSAKQREATRIIFRCCQTAVQRGTQKYFRKLLAYVDFLKQVQNTAKIIAIFRLRGARVDYSLALERWRFNLRQAARYRNMTEERNRRMLRAAKMIKNSNQRAAWCTWKVSHAQYRRVRSILARLVRAQISKSMMQWHSAIARTKLYVRDGRLSVEIFKSTLIKYLQRVYHHVMSRWRSVNMRDKVILKEAHSTLRTNSKNYHDRLISTAWQRWRRLMLDERLLMNMKKAATYMMHENLQKAHLRRLDYRFTLWSKETMEWTIRRKNQQFGTKLIFIWTATFVRDIKRKKLKKACERWSRKTALKKVICRQLRRCLVFTEKAMQVKKKKAWVSWKDFLAEAIADQKDFVKTMRLFDNALVNMAWRKAHQQFKIWKSNTVEGKNKNRTDANIISKNALTRKEVLPSTYDVASSISISDTLNDSIDLSNQISSCVEEHGQNHLSLSVDISKCDSPHASEGVGSPLTSVAFAEKQRRKPHSTVVGRYHFKNTSQESKFSSIRKEMKTLLQSMHKRGHSSNPSLVLKERTSPKNDVNFANGDLKVDTKLHNAYETPSQVPSLFASEEGGSEVGDSPTRKAIIQRAVSLQNLSALEEADRLQNGDKEKESGHASGRQPSVPTMVNWNTNFVDGYYDAPRGESPSLRRMRRAKMGLLY